MIEKAESERKCLAHRLEQFQLIDFPRCRHPGNHRTDSNDTDPDKLENGGHQESSKFVANGHDPSLTNTSSPHETKSPSAKLSSSVVVTHSSNPVSVSMTTLAPPPVPSGAGAKTKRASKASSGAEKKDKKPKKETKGGSRKRKSDADPNAPKKPSNAFFWFCQEHRHRLQEQIRGNAFGQHDLTKALAKLWGETGTEDRKVRGGTCTYTYVRTLHLYVTITQKKRLRNLIFRVFRLNRSGPVIIIIIRAHSPPLLQKFYDRYATDKQRYDREMSDYAAKLKQQKAVSTATSETPLLDTSLDASDDSMMM